MPLCGQPAEAQACCACRGSTGFGEASMQTLPGHVGSVDVADCIAALDAAVALGQRLLQGLIRQ